MALSVNLGISNRPGGRGFILQKIAFPLRVVSATLLSLPQDLLLVPQSKTFDFHYGRGGGCVDVIS